MPVVAIVDGVKIEFYPDEHPPPHFHALCRVRGADRNPDLQGIAWLAASRKTQPCAIVGCRAPIGLMNAWAAVEELRKPERIND
jgi:hypothetical protein